MHPSPTGRLIAAALCATFVVAQPAIACGLSCLTGHDVFAEHAQHGTGHGGDGASNLPCDRGSVSVPDHWGGQPLGAGLPAVDAALPDAVEQVAPVLAAAPRLLISHTPETLDPPPRA